MGRLSENSVLNLKNKSHTVTAEIEVGDRKPAQGVIIAQGGAFGGWVLYAKDGAPKPSTWAKTPDRWSATTTPRKPALHRHGQLGPARHRRRQPGPVREAQAGPGVGERRDAVKIASAAADLEQAT